MEPVPVMLPPSSFAQFPECEACGRPIYCLVEEDNHMRVYCPACHVRLVRFGADGPPTAEKPRPKEKCFPFPVSVPGAGTIGCR